MELQDLNLYWVLIGFSLVVILSYLFNFFSSLTRIPSVVMLIATGFILSLFYPMEELMLQPFLEFLGAVGLIMIVLEASLDLELKKEKKKVLFKAVLVAFLLLILVSAGGAWLIISIFDCSLKQALFYSVPLSIMSSAIIIPSVSHLNEHTKEFLIFEAAFSDIFGIMVFYFMQDSLELAPEENLASHITVNLLITAVISVLLGYFVIFVILKVKAQVKLFLPISVLVLLYSVGKLFHLSSLVFILAFGLMINNRDLFFKGSLLRLVKLDDFASTLSNLKVLTLEVSFLVRTFFFIVFGMTISMEGMEDIWVYIFSLAFLGFLYLSRALLLKGVKATTLMPSLWIAPRGLISILLFFAIPKEMILPEFKPAILLAVILFSNLVMTFGLMRHKPGSEDAEVPEEKPEKDDVATGVTEFPKAESSEEDNIS